ncbi:hypothetical protein PT974_04785 [Cladobotryum mycophilum]|uniref:Protein kinase domain-containing protein n=1 Tax=Cladobotryum mycophilum TaxID=491253 RepID=A0ABR0SQ61_9HYPO
MAEALVDIHPGNLLLGCQDDSAFMRLEQEELSNPVPRNNYLTARYIFSRGTKPVFRPMLLADFGETRLGPGPHGGDIMPIMYRAPEVILLIQWSFPVDIWSIGLTNAWDMLASDTLFTGGKEHDDYSDGAHLAELIAALSTALEAPEAQSRKGISLLGLEW